MSTSYTRPLSNGWDRMKKALFQPFDITKWFRVGFTAWLAGLTDCNGGSGGSSSDSGFHDWDKFFSFPETAWEWLVDNPLWANLIILGLVFLFVFITVLVWISSRAKFMFLHNVALDRSDISTPWHEYRKEGNSLFIFNFFYGWIAFAVIMLVFAYVFVTAKELYYADPPGVIIFWSVTTMVLMFLGYLVVFGYISLFLKDFVVPLMYKHRVGVLRGWGKFLGLFGRKFFSFILYGLFVLVLGIGVVMAVLLFALFTCCIGLLLIAIPYLGTVVLLPVFYLFRAFSIEFLAQFGDDFNVFPKKDIETGEGHLGMVSE